MTELVEKCKGAIKEACKTRPELMIRLNRGNWEDVIEEIIPIIQAELQPVVKLPENPYREVIDIKQGFDNALDKIKQINPDTEWDETPA